MTHLLRYAARTDRGLLRANNQDSVFAGDRLLVIADGMGGHAAGDVASRLVVAAFVDLDELPLGSDMVRPLTDATRSGNAAIAEMVDENPEFDGMGTTLTALLFDGPLVALAHVGDSRAYLYRNGVLHQISHDDTFVQSLVDDGRITADEAAHHPQRSLLLRALNGTEMDPSITLRETSAGDRFLICSDGLSDVVSPESIADALAGPDPDQVADTLIQLALVGGGPDNVTVIVADVLETGSDGGFGVSGGVDPEATGPMQPIHLTQKMPRVPLPPIPEDVPAKPEYASAEEGPSLHDEYDDEFDGPDFPPDVDDFASDAPDDDPAAPDGSSGAPGPAGDRRMVSAPPRHRWQRRWAFALALAVLVGVGLTGSYLWAHSKYYVGDNDDQVAVFRGVNGSLLGWKFASVQENSCGASAANCTPLKVDDLVQAARDQVNAGIPVSTLADARAVMTRLNSQQLPPCPTPTTAALVTSPTAAPTGSAAASVVPPPLSPASSPADTALVRPTTPHPTTPHPTTVHTTAVRTTAVHTTAGHPATPPRVTTTRTTVVRPTAPLTHALTPGRPTIPVRPSVRPTVRTTTVAKPPTPVTTTVTVTVDPLQPPASVSAGVGQRLRSGGPLEALVARTTERKPLPISVRVSTAEAPVTRAEITGATPTVTVFTTVTSTPLPTSGPTSSGTPLVSPAPQPGVTCRPVS